jgi:hypothetical protein
VQLPPYDKDRSTFQGGGKTYIITCTASVNSFDKYVPKFEKILETFKVPDPVPDKMAKSFDWNEVLTMGLVGGVIGGVVAGLLAIMKWFTKKGKPDQRRESMSEAFRQ